MPLLPAAIGIILSPDHTQVLLIKRCDLPLWILPGGGVESFEKVEDALVREVLEETGYHVQILRKCAEYSPINRLSAFTTVFICQIQSGQSRLSTETSAIAFYPLSQLPSTFFPIHQQWLKEILSFQGLIQRNLTEVSYYALFKYLIRHPWQVLRYAWTRMIQT